MLKKGVGWEMIPDKIKITESTVSADGGAIFLYGKDDFGSDIEIFLDWSKESVAKGRAQLYLNDEKIKKRSDDEEDLIEALNKELVLGSSEADLINKIIANVKSDKY